MSKSKLTVRNDSALDLTLLEQALDRAPVGIILVDSEGIMQWVNQQVVETLGYEKSELVGELVELIVPKKSRKIHVTMRKKFSKHPESRPMGLGRQLHGEHKSGKLIPLEVGINHINLNNKDYFITSISNVTAANRIKEQLTQAQKMEAMSRMTDNMVHDFKNTLGGVLSFLEIIKASDIPFTPKQKKNFDSVCDSCSQTQDFALKILNSFRGKKCESNKFGLNKFFKNNFQLFQTLLGIKHELKFMPSSNELVVRANEDKLTQLIMNLLVNSRDELKVSGKVTIHILKKFLKDTPRIGEANPVHGHFAVITITDNGPGIDSSILPSIFDPFFTTKGSQKGTGLGLAIAYEITRSCGGFIEAMSPPGEGATFKVYIPTAG